MEDLEASLLRLTLVERSAGEIAFLHAEKERPGVKALSVLEVQAHLEVLEERGWVEPDPQAGRWRITEPGRRVLLSFVRWEFTVEHTIPPRGAGRAVGQGAARGGTPQRGEKFKVNRAANEAPRRVGEVIAFRHLGPSDSGLGEIEVAWVDLIPGDVLVRWDPVEGPHAGSDTGKRAGGASSLVAFRFTGTYQDERGAEEVVWHVRPVETPGDPIPRFEIGTVIRGVEVRGFDFDGLDPVDSVAAAAAALGGRSELTNCVLSGLLPCVLEANGERQEATVTFRLDLSRNSERAAQPKTLRLEVSRGSVLVQVEDDWFEDGLQRLAANLPEGEGLVSCVTCLFSDYSPYGHGLTGMLCHRGAKEEYLAVRSKYEYWSVPVTEIVMETHFCDEYRLRLPGTGYRG